MCAKGLFVFKWKSSPFCLGVFGFICSASVSGSISSVSAPCSLHHTSLKRRHPQSKVRPEQEQTVLFPVSQLVLSRNDVVHVVTAEEEAASDTKPQRNSAVRDDLHWPQLVPQTWLQADPNLDLWEMIQPQFYRSTTDIVWFCFEANMLNT